MSTKPIPNCASTQDGPFRVISDEVAFPDGGTCGIYTRYTWDGVSQYPTCNGPIDQVRVVNTSATYSGKITLPARRRGTTTIIVDPGTDQTVRGGQLNSFGIETASDMDRVGLSNNLG